MVDDPAATPRKPGRKGGRPSRAEASRKSLLGIDLTACDPWLILATIASDASAPAAARVAACKALIDNARDGGTEAGGDARINTRAVEMPRQLT